MPKLLAIRGPLTGSRLTFEQDEIRFGRATECDVSIPDATVSRIHAAIVRRRLAWLLEDRESASGTFLNDRLVAKPEALAPNDEIRLGGSIFLFDSEFDLQNAEFSDNSIYLARPTDETMEVRPVATLDSVGVAREPAPREGVEFLTELGELFDSSRVPFGEALESSLNRLARMLISDITLLMLYDTLQGELRATAAVAEGDVLADDSLLRKVFHERRAILLSDRPKLAPHPAEGAPGAPACRSVVAAPLLADENCLGVLYFERQELDAYSLKDLRLVQSLGRLMGVFIETRRRMESLILKSNYQLADSPLVGSSPAFRKVVTMIQRVAPSDASVLLVGETGTGKELLASEIHRLSPRKDGPFVPVNCAAIPESLFESELFGHEKGAFTGAHQRRMGLIEQANGGTLFLDEVGEMSLSLQPKLLRFLQERTFSRVGGNRLIRADVRVVAATNRDLSGEVNEGRFREDLYHRLSVFPIHVPPLRERREDIRLLAEHFLRQAAKSVNREIAGISDEALIQLERYSWPGNIRELANSIERAALLAEGKILGPREFQFETRRDQDGAQVLARTPVTMRPVDWQDDPGSMPPLAEIEKKHIVEVYNACEGNQVQTAEVLGIHRNTLRKKLMEYGVL